MGLAKRALEEEEARGWRSMPEFVCQECVTDLFLRRIVEKFEEDEQCTFCNGTKFANRATPVDVLLEAVADGLNAEYENPLEQVGWDSEERAYHLPTTETADILSEEGAVDDYRVALALSLAFDHDWVPKNPYSSRPEQRLLWGWDRFAEFVKHERRYTFMLPSVRNDHDDETTSPEDMLPEVERTVTENGLTTIVPAGTTLYRARSGRSSFAPTATELGTPPRELAQANRMTPAGIGAFYASSTQAGAVSEVRGYDKESPYLAVGQFVTARDMKIIDLRHPPTVPSLFDEANRHKRSGAQFLRQFVALIAKPTEPDDRHGIDYVPTQVVSEYLRVAIEDDDERVVGLAWRSAQSNADSFVLAVTNDECRMPETAHPDTMLILQEVRSISTMGAATDAS